MSLTHFRNADSSAPAAITIQALQNKKSQGTPIVALTAYDYATARLVGRGRGSTSSWWGIPWAMVVMGYDNTPAGHDGRDAFSTPRAVRRAVRHAMMWSPICPSAPYQVSTAEGVANATTFP